MKVSEDFVLEEFVDPTTYQNFGGSSLWFIDKRVIDIAQFIRDRFKEPVVINNWKWDGGGYRYSGFRPPACKIGASLSQHRFGRAIDVKLPKHENNGADMLRVDIRDHFDDLYKKLGVTTIESGKFAETWCHIDTRLSNKHELLIVKP